MEFLPYYFDIIHEKDEYSLSGFVKTAKAEIDCKIMMGAGKINTSRRCLSPSCFYERFRGGLKIWNGKPPECGRAKVGRSGWLEV